MANNFLLNAGSGGVTLGSLDDGGVQYQIVVGAFNVSGVATKVSATDPLPIIGVDTAGAAYGQGMLIQGDDGSNRTNILCDASGHLQVDILTDPVLDRATDNVGVALVTDAIMNDTTALTPKYAVINVAGAGNNTLIAAVSGKNIRVLAYTIVVGAAVNVSFEDGAGGTALTGVMELPANGGVSVPFCPVGHFETSDTTLLNLQLSGAVSVDGHITYVEF